MSELELVQNGKFYIWVVQRIRAERIRVLSSIPFPIEPRVVCISITDPDTTDSSIDEKGECFPCKRVKCYVIQIDIQPACKPVPFATACARKRHAGEISSCQQPANVFAVSNSKFYGVRKTLWKMGDRDLRFCEMHAALVCWDTYNITGEATMVYDNATIKLCSPSALTNFVLPPMREKPHAHFLKALRMSLKMHKRHII